MISGFGEAVAVNANIVAGYTDEFLLGVNFMQQHGATMYFDRNEVLYSEDGRAAVLQFRMGDGTGNARVAAVRMVRKTHIAGRTVMSVEVSVVEKGNVPCYVQYGRGDASGNGHNSEEWPSTNAIHQFE
ncbi:hypothetical protein PC129_g20888 [Phytophthora cactorum]|uniref:Uncharacterized protein n=2 Tax=Phytophthora cactorum TaxID=29920 RepID=A0A329RDN9_9STRA|nr:hypothetical protein Pcac1_g5275 [Phytophthora cactorum]KAG2797693.1 hypothetical protein PC111_g21177 [Phytophthora cactorum]KAG2876925.1 hypothetical protein PC114_g23924 [Phytophthora cactorum]KAG2895806.1 hypothetical protein PC117_g23157 [Phytophthora cactorum]KAG2999139.1 hypothetical protein PC120_g20967 [Phytophthora cactorum]